MLIAGLILVVTYVGVAFTRLPRVNIDRPSAAFTGAVLMVLLGVLTFNQAVQAVDFNTIALLLGMMVVVSAFKVAGFFDLLASKSLSVAATPLRLLFLVIGATGVASAFLVNDAVVLLFTPVVARICRARKLDPVPYLIAEAMASNIGSVATIVGNPQNMLIGITSGISFARFFLYLAPVAVLSGLALAGVIYLFYRKSFQAAAEAPAPDSAPFASWDNRALVRLAPVLAVTLPAFFVSSFIHVGLPLIAVSAAALTLLLSPARPSTIIKEVDWVLLLFFGGLFIVIGGAHQAGVLDRFIEVARVSPDFSGILSVMVVSTVVSQLVSNVPLTMLFLPVLRNVPGQVLWIALAAGSTLGGNLTIIGAVANIIVVEGAARDGVKVGFMPFLKVGAVVTAITVALGIAILGLEHAAGWLV